MNHKLLSKLAVFGLSLCLAPAAMAQVEGMTTSIAPGLPTGDEISAFAGGDIWASNPGVYFSAKLIVDGVTVWTNGGKGIQLPTSWPGLVFNYKPTWVLTPGLHNVVWQGTYNPVILPNSGILWYYSVNITAP